MYYGKISRHNPVFLGNNELSFKIILKNQVDRFKWIAMSYTKNGNIEKFIEKNIKMTGIQINWMHDLCDVVWLRCPKIAFVIRHNWPDAVASQRHCCAKHSYQPATGDSFRMTHHLDFHCERRRKKILLVIIIVFICVWRVRNNEIQTT